ncbi:Mu-like prophage protein gp36 [Rhodoferax sp. OV413]|uniref:gp436 family protein n=1 Tax=Rhodoferax sp. OV413 TaxID=1855285 RepID=UPI000880C860|nr:phage protein Gp36 family protein [Rhodoferax sp. OV413]SDO76413.1 Mu-like prophage protein gp36 [Rhodoferax sp. OV413]
MQYATATVLLTRYDAQEIAQRVAREIPRLVTGELLAAVAAAADLSDYTNEEAAQAAVAMIKVDTALKDAADTIDSYISSRYILPLSPVPPVLERVACELARYFLYDDQVTDVIKQRYDDCIKLLSNVQAGKVKLGADGETGDEPASGGAPEVVSAGRVWARGNSTGFL